MARCWCAMDEGILLEEGGRSMIIIIYTVLYCISEAFFSMTSRCEIGSGAEGCRRLLFFILNVA